MFLAMKLRVSAKLHRSIITFTISRIIFSIRASRWLRWKRKSSHPEIFMVNDSIIWADSIAHEDRFLKIFYFKSADSESAADSFCTFILTS